MADSVQASHGAAELSSSAGLRPPSSSPIPGCLGAVVWLKATTAANFWGVSRFTIGRHAKPWQLDYSPGYLRWKYLRLDRGAKLRRRYFGPDVIAFCRNSLLIEPQHDPQGGIPAAWPASKGAGLWVPGKIVASYLDVSLDVVQRRGIPAQESRVAFRIRCEDRRSEGGRALTRYLLADADALLIDPVSVAVIASDLSLSEKSIGIGEGI